MLDKKIFQYLKNGNLLPVIQAGQVRALGKPTAKAFETLIGELEPDSIDPVVLLPELGLLSIYVQEVPDIAWEIIEYSEKSLQVIFPQGRNVPNHFLKKDGSIAIRVESKGPFHKLLFSMGSPLACITLPSNLKEADLLSQYDKVLNLPAGFEWKIKPGKLLALGTKGEIKFYND